MIWITTPKPLLDRRYFESEQPSYYMDSYKSGFLCLFLICRFRERFRTFCDEFLPQRSLSGSHRNPASAPSKPSNPPRRRKEGHSEGASPPCRSMCFPTAPATPTQPARLHPLQHHGYPSVPNSRYKERLHPDGFSLPVAVLLRLEASTLLLHHDNHQMATTAFGRRIDGEFALSASLFGFLRTGKRNRPA